MSLQDPLGRLTDHDLLLGGVKSGIDENRAAADRWARLLVYFRRHDAKTSTDDHFALTARQQTAVEVGELWGMAEGRVRSQLNIAVWLSDHFAFAWELCLTGQLDTYRATLIADAARHGLDRPEEHAALAAAMQRFLTRHLEEIPGIGVPLVTCTVKQLRNKLAYEVRKLRAGDAEARFRQAHESRGIQVTDGEDGISWLTLAGTADRIQAAGHRLTLAAKKHRAEGDPRTLAQLRADMALDLLIRGETDESPLPVYARPVVNLTVPLQTVLGISDDPGCLSGGTVVPAGLARAIAQQPGATWHRMLTDPAGQCLEVSTTRYRPTPAIWSAVVAGHSTCFRPGCDRPATECELDHRTRWPDGPTSTANLWPACKTDHTAKHADGFRIAQTPTGSFALVTPAGFAHQIRPASHPVGAGLRDVPPIQFSATELLDAVDRLRSEAADSRPPRPDLAWEFELRHLQLEPYAPAS